MQIKVWSNQGVPFCRNPRNKWQTRLVEGKGMDSYADVADSYADIKPARGGKKGRPRRNTFKYLLVFILETGANGMLHLHVLLEKRGGKNSTFSLYYGLGAISLH